MKEANDQILELTSNIVAAHLSNNEVPTEKVSDLIEQVYGKLSQVKRDSKNSFNRPKPAVSPEDSVQPDYIVCLEDGKKLKMLKRHLKAVYGMSLHEYRERWGLPADYPAVAPNYAKQRSRLAKEIGLGIVGRGVAVNS